MPEKRQSVLNVIKRKSLLIKNTSSKKWPQILAGLCANLCFFTIGLHFAWSSPSIPRLQSEDSTIPVTETEISWIVSAQPIGDFFGAALAAYLSNVIGRKKTILLTTIPQLLAFVIIALAQSANLLILARFISGVGEGAIYICVPIYLGEILEPIVRGRMGATATLTIAFGIAFINVIGYYFSLRDTALISLSAPILTIFAFSFMPETPYYCLMKNRKEEAEKNLKFLRRTDDVSQELESINDSVQNQMKNPTTFKVIFTDRANRKAILTMIAIRLIQQGCGITAILYFLIPIFNMSGIQVSSITATLIYCTTQTAACLVCTVLVDKFGRKPLLMISLLGALVSTSSLGAFFYLKENLHYDVSSFSILPLISLLTFSILFSVGYGTIPILLLSEFFPANVKTKALCIMQCCLATMFFSASKIFLLLLNTFGIFLPFVLFSIVAVIGIFFTIYFVPETNRKTLQEIQDWFNRRQTLKTTNK